MASGFKYMILVSADTRQAQQALHNLSSTFGNMGSGFAARMYNMGKYLDGTRDKVTGILQRLGMGLGPAAVAGTGAAIAMVAADSVRAAGEAIAEIGGALTDMGIMGMRTIVGGLAEVANIGGEVEATVMRIKMLGGYTDKAAWSAVKGVQKIVEFTPYMQKDVMKVAELLATTGHTLEPLKDQYGKILTLNSAAHQGMTKISKDTLSIAGNMEVTASSMLLDLAAVSGQVGPKFTNMVQSLKTAFMSGQIRNLRENLSGEYYKILGDAIGDAKKKGLDSAGRTGLMMEAIYKELVRKGQLGFSAEMSSSWEGIISNFKEIPEVLKRGLADPEAKDGPYQMIKQAMLGLYKAIKPVITDQNFLQAIRDSIVPVVQAVGWLAAKLGEVIGFMAKLVGANPWLAKMVTYFTAIGSIASLVSGIFLTISGTLIAFGVTAVITLLTLAVILGAAAAAATGLLVPLTAIGLVALPFILYGIGMLGGTVGTWNKVSTLVEDLGTLFKGLSEAVSFWGDTTTNVLPETKTALEKAGLWDTFLKIVDVMSWIDEAWEGFKERLSKGMGPIMPNLVAGWDELTAAASKLWRSVRIGLEMIGVLQPATDESVAGARGAFSGLADAILVMAQITAAAFRWIAWSIDAVTPHGETLVGILLWTVGATHLLANAATIATASFMLGLTPIAVILAVIVSMIYGVITAFQDLQKNGIGAVADGLFSGKYFKEHGKRVGDFTGDYVKMFGSSIGEDIGDINKSGFVFGDAGWYTDASKGLDKATINTAWREGADGRLRTDAPYAPGGAGVMGGLSDNLSSALERLMSGGAAAGAQPMSDPYAGGVSVAPTTNVQTTVTVHVGDEPITSIVENSTKSYLERNGVTLPMTRGF